MMRQLVGVLALLMALSCAHAPPADARGARGSSAADRVEALAAEGGPEPSSIKLMLRRAACHVALRHWKEARRDFEAVLRLEPTCSAATQLLRSPPCLMK